MSRPKRFQDTEFLKNKYKYKIKMLREKSKAKEIIIDSLISKVKKLEKKLKRSRFETKNELDNENMRIKMNDRIDSEELLYSGRAMMAKQSENGKSALKQNEKSTQNRNFTTNQLNISENSANQRKAHQIEQLMSNIVVPKETENIISVENSNVDYIFPVKKIFDVFTSKSKKGEFKVNCTLKQFVDFASANYEFNLQNRKIFKSKNPMRIYIITNLRKIIKYLIDNINTLELNSICSTLFLINSEIDSKHKLVVCMDMLYECKIPTKLLYLYSALFNNLGIPSDLKGDQDDFICKASKKDYSSKAAQQDVVSVTSEMIRGTIMAIMYHQFCIDTDIYSDPTVYKYLEIIKENFGLKKPQKTLFEIVEGLINQKIEMIKCVNNKYELNPIGIAYSECIKCICHVLDWDYTYNTLIIEKLNYKKIAYHAYLLGVLTINAYRNIPALENISGNKIDAGFLKEAGLQQKFQKSVRDIFNEMTCQMEDDSDISVINYLILKHIRGDFTENYIEFNEKKLGEAKVEFMKEFQLFK